jgi:hypothetical protein
LSAFHSGLEQLEPTVSATLDVISSIRAGCDGDDAVDLAKAAAL